jgi:predicted N-acetyltransferase YhbS
VPDTKIRAAAEDDASALAAVYRDAYRENRDLGFPAKAESATAEQVAGWIREHRVYVAADDEAMVGGVRAETTDPGRVKLSRLAVDTDRQGEGVGHALVAHVEEQARAAGHDVVWLTTPGEHPYLPDFYRGRGYERTGTYPLEYRD